MVPEHDDLFSVDDFERIRVHVGITNRTTGTLVEEGRIVYKDGVSRKDDKICIEILELHEEQFVLSVPERTGVEGHQVTLDVKVEPKRGISKKFVFGGKVTEGEAAPEKTQRLTVHLIEFENEELQEFRELFGQRQKEILEFFRAVRG